MKKLAALGVVLFILFHGCEEKFSSGDYNPSELEYNDTTSVTGLSEIGKRGIYLRQVGGDWSAKVSSTRAHWHYSEASNRSIKEPANIDFVPMIKDTADMSADDFEKIEKMQDAGELRHIIAFNHPDSANKANLTVSEAINLWPQLEQFGVPISSPLCADAEGPWIEDFMAEAALAGLRVDYVSVMWYDEFDIEGFLSMVERVYNKYNKPVWITRFSLVNARLSQVTDFLETVLPELDSRDYVYRYAWESGEVNTPTAFWDPEGNLTTRGQYYADLNPNMYLSIGRDDWIDISSLVNLVVDGGFESGTLDAWAGYGTEVVAGEEAYNGGFCGKAAVTGWGSSINYPSVAVETPNTYYISFAARLESEVTANAPEWYQGVRMLVRDPDDNTIQYAFSPFITSPEWQEYSFQVDLPEGVTEIMLVCWRPAKTPAFLIDDLLVAKIE